MCPPQLSLLFSFFFNDTATTEIYTLSLHDALPISFGHPAVRAKIGRRRSRLAPHRSVEPGEPRESCEPCEPCERSEEHTSELQSRSDLVCRLLLEKKKYIRQ